MTTVRSHLSHFHPMTDLLKVPNLLNVFPLMCTLVVRKWQWSHDEIVVMIYWHVIEARDFHDETRFYLQKNCSTCYKVTNYSSTYVNTMVYCIWNKSDVWRKHSLLLFSVGRTFVHSSGPWVWFVFTFKFYCSCL